ncbi:hypothetical protein B0J15DRAFT_474119 [Fusarium solani]|uniref:Uncharacterized protein n=1 Tax=Fusarium solani TaxID=169388 RepID=A0A9P9RDK8_FUSSL|nr:uncharacterized protein B0J15DRAFT_474119 [Fusarium solani]KAH7275092.1 hypothetical protein B0J15DRAFT_474119 [Fusarium solani]
MTILSSPLPPLPCYYFCQLWVCIALLRATQSVSPPRTPNTRGVSEHVSAADSKEINERAKLNSWVGTGPIILAFGQDTSIQTEWLSMFLIRT